MLELCAYHEAGRVVFAYQCGYSCDGITLSETDPGQGDSKLNAGHDMDYINAILSGKPQTTDTGKISKTIEVAKNLMKITLAGSCAEVVFGNTRSTDTETEVTVPGQDMKYVELVQKFLSQQIRLHPDDYPDRILKLIFQELKKPDIWQAVDSVARAALNNPDTPLTRYYIEDALMAARFEIKRHRPEGMFEIGLSEEVQKPAGEAAATSPHLNENNPLDAALVSFLRKLRSEWTEEELQLSVTYLKGAFKKYPQ